MKEFEVISTNIFQIRVCSCLSEDEALKRTQAESPAGTSNNWQKYDYEEEPTMKPIACKDSPETHKHFMFVC